MLIYLSMIDDPVDKEKFERLYLKYRQPMYNAAYKILRNQSDAEDALQEAFYLLTKNLQNVHEENGLKTKYYLVVIIRSVSLTMLRKKKKKPSIAISDFEENADNTPSVVEIIEGNESYNAVVQAIYSLKKIYSEVLILKYVQGYSTHIIAKTLKISENSVYKRINKAKAELALLLNREVE